MGQGAARQPRPSQLEGGDKHSLGAEAVMQAFGVPQGRKDRMRSLAAFIYRWALVQDGVEGHEDAMQALNLARLRLKPPPMEVPALLHFYQWAMHKSENHGDMAKEYENAATV